MTPTRIAVFAAFSVALLGCPSTPDDTTPPSVARTVPDRDAQGVALNAKLTVEFSEAMQAASINGDSVKLAIGTTSVAGTVSYDDAEKKAELQPSAPLAENLEYTVTVTTAAKDVAGNGLAAAYSWKFTTLGNAPHVTSTTPADGMANVARAIVIKFQFDKAIDPTSLMSGNLALSDSMSNAVAGTVSYDAATFTASLTPAAGLAEGKQYTAIAKAAIKGVNGLQLPADKTVAFTVVNDAPVVQSTVPADMAMSVALDTMLQAHFSEPIDAATLTEASFFLKEGANMLTATGTLDAARTTATLAPASALLEGRTYTVTLTAAVKDDFGNPLAAAKAWTFTTLATVPTIVSALPTDNAMNISGNAPVKVTFSEAMEPATLTSATFEVKAGSTVIPGTRTWDAPTRTVTFQPTGAYPGGSSIAVHVSNAVTDTSGIHLASDMNVSFTVSNAPAVSASMPSPNDQGVPLGAQVSLTFSTAMNVSTLTAANAWLEDSTGAKVAATYTPSATGLVMAPSMMLKESSVYTVVVSTGVKSATSVAFAAEYRFTFSTSGIPPVVMSVTPSDGSTNVSVSSTVSVVFDEDMDVATFNASSFSLSDGANDVAGTLTAQGPRTLVFTPSAKLRAQTAYTATVTSGVTDVSHNALATAFRFAFSTEALPRLVSVLPANGANGVATNAKIVLAFNKHIASAIGVTGVAAAMLDAVTLTDGAGARVDGAVTYSSATFTAVIRPQAAGSDITWAAGTRYTIAIDGSKLLDANGNAVAGNLVTSFVAGAGADATAPALVTSDPGNGATGFSRTTAVWAQLSEPLNPVSVTTTTVRVFDGAALVPGTASYDAATRRVLFTPSALWPAAHALSFEIGAVADLSGNAKASVNTIGFTTADNDAPAVASSAPADQATNVSSNAAVRIAFTEAIDARTLSVTSSAGAGTVSYDAASATALFVPSAAFTGGATVTVTVDAGLKDLEGKATVDPISFSFTTVANAAQDVTAPTATVLPANAATQVSALQAITVTFSEPMRAGTVNASAYALREHNGPSVLHRAAFSAAGDQLVLTPLDGLKGGVTYDLDLGAGLKDLAGNALTALSTSFTVESVKPSVSTTSPLASSTVGSGVQVSIVFSESLDVSSIDASTLGVSFMGNALLGAVSYDAASRTALFQPSKPLLDGAHTVTLQAASIRDLAGNTLTPSSGATYAFTFTVSSNGPSVAMANPCGTQIDADDFGTQTVTVKFDRAVRRSGALALDGTALKLQRNGMDQAIAVAHTADTDTAVITPGAALLAGQTYTVVATTLVLATNNSAAMASQYSCTFTTQRVVFQDAVDDTLTGGYTLTGSGSNGWQRINSGDDTRSSIVWRGGSTNDGQGYVRNCTSGLQGAAADQLITVEKQIDLTGYTTAEVRFQVMDDLQRTGVNDEGRLIVNDGTDHVIKTYAGQNAANPYVREGKGSGNLSAFVNKTVKVRWQVLIKGFSAGLTGNCANAPAGKKGLFVDDVLIVGQ